jgi:hypothetical protein
MIMAAGKQAAISTSIPIDQANKKERSIALFLVFDDWENGLSPPIPAYATM